MSLPCLLEKVVSPHEFPFAVMRRPQCWGAVVAALRKEGRVAPSNLFGGA